MKVLHIYKDFYPPVRGGMERHMGLMCRYQREWGEVEALTCGHSWRTHVRDRDGTRVTEVGELGRFQSAPVSPSFPWRLLRSKADVYVVHVPNPTAELSWLLTRPHGRLVVRYQSDVVRQAAAMRLYGRFQRRFLEMADLIIPSSPQYLAGSLMLRGLESRCEVIPLGVEPHAFAPSSPSAPDEIRARYGGPFVFFCGKHRYYKGLDVLIRAAAHLTAPLAVGGDGPEHARCEKLSRSTGADIRFIGELSDADLADHLHACAVFAYPSVARSEAFGIAILEAHACGTPVVATRLGTGIEYANLDGVTGLNVTPGDPEALAAALNTLLANEDLRRGMGEAARARVVSELNARVIARREWELYERVMAM